MANKKISTSEVRLGGEIINLFRKTKDIWDRYPDLWLMGGGARDSFLNWLGDQNLGYTRESIGLRDLGLVYFGNKDDGLEISEVASLNNHLVKLSKALDSIGMTKESRSILKDRHCNEV